MNINEHLWRYQADGFQHVEGWCRAQLFETLGLLNGLGINKSGGCLEIGVHHGKLYILLNQAIDATETSYAIDLFERQALNIDYSGAGSLEIFKSNLEKYDVHKGANTTIIAGDSTDSALDLENRIRKGSLRFISIDGGHTAEHTVSDLTLANKLVANEGVVILDDIFSRDWPGVTEGVGKFLGQYPTLVPFAIGHNKLYLSKLSYQRVYCELFSTSRLATKNVNFYGNALVALL
jgi:predicted O-methyltransferase YrrM